MDKTLKLQQRSIFQNKNFMLLLIGQIVSNLGNAVHSVAVSWFIMETVGEGLSGTYMAIFGVSVLLPYIIFGPLSGVFVDRINRKKIIFGTDIIRGSLILILGLLVYNNFYPMISLFAITFLGAIFGSFFNPAVDASMPNIVEEKDLTQANSLNGISRSLTWIIGGAISGFLYYRLGIVGVFVVNGLSFVLSGISEMFINIPNVKKTKEESSTTSFWLDFKDGLKYIRSQKTLMKIMVVALFLNFLINPIFQIIFPKTIRFTLGMGAREYGIVNGLFPVGAMLGMILISTVAKFRDNIGVVNFGIVTESILLAGFGIFLLPSILSVLGNMSVYFIFCGITVLLMICNSLINIPLFTALQRKVPDELRGRFFGMFNTLTQGIVPVGLGLFGILSDIVSPSTIYLGAGISSLLIGLWIVFTPDFKEIME
ncbi:MFS transporter [Alkaliphilus transvaalensis]|uniref:MFS transporter n=1 Tax=Alkaliphilus transvaalensis TaxID=114628 RepID=UPI000479E85D|nr:MFS transporter [Alkaliphilus transvaalensis]